MSMRHMTMVQRAVGSIIPRMQLMIFLLVIAIFAEPILSGYASITEQINSSGFTNTNMLSNINVVTELPGDDTGGNVNHGPVGKPEISGNLQQDETLTVDV